MRNLRKLKFLIFANFSMKLVLSLNFCTNSERSDPKLSKNTHNVVLWSIELEKLVKMCVPSVLHQSLLQTFKYKMSSVFQHKCSFITIKDSSNCSAIRTTSNSLFRYSILLSTKLKSSNKLILKPKSHRVSSTSNHAEIFKKSNAKIEKKKE